jgi:hypothetical protein
VSRNLRTLTVTEVCARTGWPRTKVVRMFHAGKLAGIQESEHAQIYILESSLDELFERALDAARPASSSRGLSRRAADDVDAAILPDGPRHFA